MNRRDTAEVPTSLRRCNAPLTSAIGRRITSEANIAPASSKLQRHMLFRACVGDRGDDVLGAQRLQVLDRH
jgi:hypothetical protein